VFSIYASFFPTFTSHLLFHSSLFHCSSPLYSSMPASFFYLSSILHADPLQVHLSHYLSYIPFPYPFPLQTFSLTMMPWYYQASMQLLHNFVIITELSQIFILFYYFIIHFFIFINALGIHCCGVLYCCVKIKFIDMYTPE